MSITNKIRGVVLVWASVALAGCVIVPAHHVGPGDKIVTELETGRTYVRPKSDNYTCIGNGGYDAGLGAGNSNGTLILDSVEIPLGYYDYSHCY